MKRVIRESVFETNSSSVHAICIATDDNVKRFPKRVKFTFGDFGWRENIIDSVSEKASYLWTGICDGCNVDIATEAMGRIKEILEQRGINVTFDKWNKTLCYNENGIEYPNINGYVDHAGELYDLITELISDPDLLLSYLFDDRSYVHTGNDNDESGMYEINESYPHYEYYKEN